jgi:hypothetical protein
LRAIAGEFSEVCAAKNDGTKRAPAIAIHRPRNAIMQRNLEFSNRKLTIENTRY